MLKKLGLSVYLRSHEGRNLGNLSHLGNIFIWKILFAVSPEIGDEVFGIYRCRSCLTLTLVKYLGKSPSYHAPNSRVFAGMRFFYTGRRIFGPFVHYGGFQIKCSRNN